MRRILIVEGNLKEENQSFSAGGIKTHTESLKDSISYFTNKLIIDVVNPSSDENINEVAKEHPDIPREDFILVADVLREIDKGVSIDDPHYLKNGNSNQLLLYQLQLQKAF